MRIWSMNWLNQYGLERSDAPPVRYMKAGQKAMERSLGADPSYNGLMVKNPFHPVWDLRIGREQPYSLDELSEHLDLIEMSGARLGTH